MTSSSAPTLAQLAAQLLHFKATADTITERDTRRARALLAAHPPSHDGGDAPAWLNPAGFDTALRSLRAGVDMPDDASTLEPPVPSPDRVAPEDAPAAHKGAPLLLPSVQPPPRRPGRPRKRSQAAKGETPAVPCSPQPDPAPSAAPVHQTRGRPRKRSRVATETAVPPPLPSDPLPAVIAPPVAPRQADKKSPRRTRSSARRLPVPPPIPLPAEHRGPGRPPAVPAAPGPPEEDGASPDIAVAAPRHRRPGRPRKGHGASLETNVLPPLVPDSISTAAGTITSAPQAESLHRRERSWRDVFSRVSSGIAIYLSSRPGAWGPASPTPAPSPQAQAVALEPNSPPLPTDQEGRDAAPQNTTLGSVPEPRARGRPRRSFHAPSTIPLKPASPPPLNKESLLSFAAPADTGPRGRQDGTSRIVPSAKAEPHSRGTARKRARASSGTGSPSTSLPTPKTSSTRSRSRPRAATPADAVSRDQREKTSRDTSLAMAPEPEGAASHATPRSVPRGRGRPPKRPRLGSGTHMPPLATSVSRPSPAQTAPLEGTRPQEEDGTARLARSRSRRGPARPGPPASSGTHAPLASRPLLNRKSHHTVAPSASVPQTVAQVGSLPQEEDDNPSVQTPLTESRKRGRPPKGHAVQSGPQTPSTSLYVSNKEYVPHVVQEASTPQEGDSASAQTPLTATRKRGRPPKSNSAPQEDDGASVRMPLTATRKRGRPPKGNSVQPGPRAAPASQPAPNPTAPFPPPPAVHTVPRANRRALHAHEAPASTPRRRGRPLVPKPTSSSRPPAPATDPAPQAAAGAGRPRTRGEEELEQREKEKDGEAKDGTSSPRPQEEDEDAARGAALRALERYAAPAQLAMLRQSRANLAAMYAEWEAEDAEEDMDW